MKTKCYLFLLYLVAALHGSCSCAAWCEEAVLQAIILDDADTPPLEGDNVQTASQCTDWSLIINGEVYRYGEKLPVCIKRVQYVCAGYIDVVAYDDTVHRVYLGEAMPQE